MITFKYNLPICDTMEFESVYPEQLQMDLCEKQALRDIHDSVFVWMFVDSILVGESYGVPLGELDEELPGLADAEPSAIYCYSNTIMPMYQGKGYGKILKAHWLGLVRASGFRLVYGHARPNGSQELNALFGADFIEDFPDWYGTDERYRLYRLEL